MSKNRVIILGGGYSIKEGIDLGLWEHLKGEQIWVLNFCYKWMPLKPHTILWYDELVTKQCGREIEEISCRRICRKHKRIEHMSIHDTIQYPATRKWHENIIRQGKIYASGSGVVGGFALSIAIIEKYDEIYLLGFDYGIITDKRDKNKKPYTHWYQDKFIVAKNRETGEKLRSDGLGSRKPYRTKEGKVKHFVNSWENYNKFHKKIFNVSPKSFITAFPKLTYKEFFERLT